MNTIDNIPDDEAPDVIVHTAALVAVGIMLVGMIAFPLAGAWSRAGGDGVSATAARSHHHGSAMMVRTISAAR